MEESSSDKSLKVLESFQAEKHAIQASSSASPSQMALAPLDSVTFTGPPPSTAITTEESAEDKEKYTVKLEMFEGPLDLLLYLIKREEINLWDIPIARITEQYLEYIQIMQNLNITLAGEFLVMAATLIYIKSKMLLPPDPTQPQEEISLEDDPRHELVYQLLEHQKFKNAAQMLYAKEEIELEVWSKPPREFQDEGEEVIAVTLFDLVAAFRDVVKRFSERVVLEYEREEITLEEKLAEIRNLLLVQETIQFSTLFERMHSWSHLIVTFLAVLELVKLSEIRILQKQAFGEILLFKN
jgi:segregation and condensation protein A